MFGIFKKKNNSKTGMKRQWGAETRTEPLSHIHTKPKVSTMAFSRIAILLTVGFWILYIFSIIIRQLIDGPQDYSFTMEAFGYALVVTMLTFSSLMYLVARHGALERFSKHKRVPRAVLDSFFSKHQPSITVLVPSYAEENSVIRKTLLSAALQEYPDMRVVLLVDDKPNPTNQDDIDRLSITRSMGENLTELLSVPHKRFSSAFRKFKSTDFRKKNVTKREVEQLSSQYHWASHWLKQMAEKEKIEDHVDIFFRDEVLKKLANELDMVEKALLQSVEEKATISRERVLELYERLVWIFAAKFEVFERKQYTSLSHEANKAMNLNSYISLMGGSYEKFETVDGVELILSSKKNGKNILTVPDSDFLLTLDADSILLQEYCLRLVYYLQQPENSKVAVTQTPYSSFRGAFSRIERLAGATTDIQHILHQGMSYHGATFWVGANAVIRKSALDDIVEVDTERGYEVKRYIQDRTVIEDTESSIDLALHGWELKNYPERLSYSATPPDFGALVVQRRRWANGGLLILPKFFETIAKRKKNNQVISRAEVMLRINYMASIAWATFGLIFLLAYPYDGRLLSPLVLLAALPYFAIMAADLKYCGYKYSDILRIYGFNLIMLPVNFAGVVKSIEQALTGKKIPFARTPKVKDRTSAAPHFVIIPLLIIGFSLFTVWRNVLVHNWGNAIFAGFNAFVATYATIAYIGLKNILVDTWLGLMDWLYVDVPVKQLSEKKHVEDRFDWKNILYQGSD